MDSNANQNDKKKLQRQRSETFPRDETIALTWTD